MKHLRKLNRVLGSLTGYQIRRVSAPATRAVPLAAKRPADEGPGKGPSPQVAFRPPADPERDRLLRRPVFVISPVRSGSTLLRMLLGAHTQLHAAHELHVRRLEVRCSTRLAQRSMDKLGLDRGDLEHLLWDRVMHRELVKSGKRWIVEKTPSNAFVYQRIAACWPDARFLFLLRHPASIAASWHEADPEKRTEEEAVLDALRYMRATDRARKGLTGHIVRYEDLTADPESVLKGICDFLEIDYEPEMLDYGSAGGGELQKGLGDWKEKIRSGKIQTGRELPGPDEVPEPLRAISRAWGYLGDSSAAATSTAHAEIAEVWPREGRIRITGAFHGLPDAADASWQLQLTLRGRPERRLSYPASTEGGRFDATFPVSDLVAGDEDIPAQWDLHLIAGTAAGEVRLRVGRHLDDVPGKKNSMVFPEQPAGPEDGAVRVRPYYTIKDNLSVECFTEATRDVQAAS